MDKYAVIRTGGKQYRISEGDILKIEKLSGKKGDKINFDDVLLAVSEKKVEIGQPRVKANVEGTVLDQIKDKKISVFKYKAKTGYHKKIGHRQNLTVVKIDKIEI